MVLGVVTAVFTEAVVLRACQAEWRSPVVNLFSTVFLILQFSSFYGPIDLLFVQCRAGEENILLKISLSSLVIQGLLLR